ncbi:TetR/AcrR family transcriptional regulator [Parvularcula dongshanensis]|uniref:AcrR family transcriptional regulator n=1 Tax=Parvularcula dongshanensis TaxID=1173995 RepID=A0A840I630_9PROT|nr:TetR/AcrR family transcriptional regulator [Parvularcula dongshanensis]MBB4660396.1 AcrR family transcriptional regulator [Parvularcula dongshanensis]
MPGLSLCAVCTRAGFTQGAFHSNFASREDPLLAVMERNMEERVHTLAEMTLDYRAMTFDQTIARIGAWLTTVSGRREWAQMAIELRLEAVRNPALARAIAVAEQRIDVLFAERIDDLVGHFGLSPRFRSTEIVKTLLVLWRGLALRDDDDNTSLPVADIFGPVCARCWVGRNEARPAFGASPDAGFCRQSRAGANRARLPYSGNRYGGHPGRNGDGRG